MTLLRSLFINVAFYAWSVLMNVGCVWVLAGPPLWTVRAQRAWAQGVLLILRLGGIGIEVRGRHNLPAGACIVACKHQSAWDTIVWHALLDDPAIVMKKELLSIPFYGWYSVKARMIPVDRKAGASAMRAMLRAAQAAADLGRPIVIFPQGTRVAPGAAAPYQPGVAALYRGLNLPAVPVALNSGRFWPRRGFLRRPGTVVLEFLEPIPPGLARDAFMAALEARTEDAANAL
jgi:1-acyl-sn-glycerol-3-phosphate acyltransferase